MASIVKKVWFLIEICPKLVALRALEVAIEWVDAMYSYPLVNTYLLNMVSSYAIIHSMLRLVLSCDDYLADLWNDGTLHPVIADQWDGVDTARLFEFMVKSAQAEQILLSDAKVWDYDKALYACYRNAI